MSDGGVYGWCTDAAAGHVDEDWGCCNVLEVLVGGEDSRRRSYRGCEKIVDAR